MLRIDFSTVLLVVLCVIPGLFAQRSRNLVCPRSFEEQGASAELGELVALGISTHGVALCVFVMFCVIIGLLRSDLTYMIGKLDAWPLHTWTSRHPLETLTFGTLYVFASFALSHWLGIVYGIFRLRSPVTSSVLKRSKRLQKWGIQGLLGERPIVYEAFSPRLRSSDGLSYLVFVELEMKDGRGFYAGQLSEFSILKDNEPHKPVYIISAYFKLNRDDEYERVQADGVLLDLSDTVLVRVIQTPPS